jgi:hypothetical protein
MKWMISPPVPPYLNASAMKPPKSNDPVFGSARAATAISDCESGRLATITLLLLHEEIWIAPRIGLKRTNPGVDDASARIRRVSSLLAAARMAEYAAFLATSKVSEQLG